MSSMTDLIEFIAQSLVDKPDEVQVEEFDEDGDDRHRARGRRRRPRQGDRQAGPHRARHAHSALRRRHQAAQARRARDPRVARRGRCPPQIVGIGSVVRAHGIRGDAARVRARPTRSLSVRRVYRRRRSASKVVRVQRRERRASSSSSRASATATPPRRCRRRKLFAATARAAAARRRRGLRRRSGRLPRLRRRGHRLGEVTAVREPARTRSARRRRARREFMLPFVEPIVVAVDVAARRIVCDPPEGLLDLDASNDDEAARDRRGRHALPRDVRVGAGAPACSARRIAEGPARGALHRSARLHRPTSTAASTTRPTAAAPAW